MKTITLLSIAILVGYNLCAQTQVSQFRGPERNGVYPEKNLLQKWPEGGPKLLWKYDKLGLGYSSAAVTSNRVFAVGTTSSTPQSKDSLTYLYSFDLNGNLLWKKALGKDWLINFPGSRSTPTIVDGLGYLVNGLGVLYCFNTETGDIVWSKNLKVEFNGKFGPWGVLDHLIIDGNNLYCAPGGDENNVVALDRKTGKIIWVSKGNGEGGGYTTPILIERGGKKIIIHQPGKIMIAIDAEDGTMIWKYDPKKQQPSSHRTPIYNNGYLFVMNNPSQGSTMLKIAEDGMNSTEVWNNPNLYLVQGDAVVLNYRIYIGGKDKKVYCVDWYTGKEFFSYQMEAAPSKIVSADNLLYCYDYLGNITLLIPHQDRFEKAGSFKVLGGNQKDHSSHPVIKDGRLNVRHDNSLFVYDIQGK